jgi:hypothetical protein
VGCATRAPIGAFLLFQDDFASTKTVIASEAIQESSGAEDPWIAASR